jgi:hypothetical protein
MATVLVTVVIDNEDAQPKGDRVRFQKNHPIVVVVVLELAGMKSSRTSVGRVFSLSNLRLLSLIVCDLFRISIFVPMFDGVVDCHDRTVPRVQVT